MQVVHNQHIKSFFKCETQDSRPVIRFWRGIIMMMNDAGSVWNSFELLPDAAQWAFLLAAALLVFIIYQLQTRLAYFPGRWLRRSRAHIPRLRTFDGSYDFDPLPDHFADRRRLLFRRFRHFASFTLLPLKNKVERRKQNHFWLLQLYRACNLANFARKSFETLLHRIHFAVLESKVVELIPI